MGIVKQGSVSTQQSHLERASHRLDVDCSVLISADKLLKIDGWEPPHDSRVGIQHPVNRCWVGPFVYPFRFFPFAPDAMPPAAALLFPFNFALAKVELEVTANTMEGVEEPVFAGGPAKEKVAAGVASFSDLVVEWDRILAPEGEQVMVEANLLVRGNRE